MQNRTRCISRGEEESGQDLEQGHVLYNIYHYLVSLESLPKACYTDTMSTAIPRAYSPFGALSIQHPAQAFEPEGRRLSLTGVGWPLQAVGGQEPARRAANGAG